MYLSGSIQEMGLACRILDYESVVFSEEALLQDISENRPQVVGLTAFTPTVCNANYIADLIKKSFPEIVTVLGGIHASALPRESVVEFKSMDYVFVGEGEILFPQFCYLALRGEIDRSADIDIPGLCYQKTDGSIKLNPPLLIEDLDALPLPDRSAEITTGAGMKGLGNRDEMRYADVLTSRGCPFKCSFCAVSVIHHRTRFRSPENVVDEITLLKREHGVSHINLIDSTFTLNKKRVAHVCEAMGRLGLTYNCNAVVNTIDYDLLKLMADTGCQKVCFGVESGSPRILEKISKKADLDKVVDTVAMARKARIPVTECSYIIGIHPDETEEDIKLTRKLMHAADADISLVSVGIPFPGTRMYQQFKDADLLDTTTDWDTYSFFGTTPRTRTKYVSNERLLYLQKEMMRTYYFSPKRIARQLRKIRSWGQLKHSVSAALSLS
jgi:radical SAM superfamily enzyme YgiQ (UPF0313 family)